LEETETDGKTDIVDVDSMHSDNAVLDIVASLSFARRRWSSALWSVPQTRRNPKANCFVCFFSSSIESLLLAFVFVFCDRSVFDDIDIPGCETALLGCRFQPNKINI